MLFTKPHPTSILGSLGRWPGALYCAAMTAFFVGFAAEANARDHPWAACALLVFAADAAWTGGRLAWGERHDAR